MESKEDEKSEDSFQTSDSFGTSKNKESNDLVSSTSYEQSKRVSLIETKES